MKKTAIACVVVAVVVAPLSFFGGMWVTERQINKRLMQDVQATSYTWNSCHSVVTGK